MQAIHCDNADLGLARLIESLYEKINDEPILIAIAGGSCAGKSTFAAKLRQRIKVARGFEAPIIAMDDFFLDIDDPKLPRKPFGIPIYDRPKSYHINELQEKLWQLLFGHEILIPKYDLPNNKRTKETILVKPAPIIILDGLFAILAIQDYGENCIRVFVDAPRELRRERRIQRDAWAGSSEIIGMVFDKLVEPNHIRFVASQKNNADFVIQGK